jgi:hypothetical protein
LPGWSHDEANPTFFTGSSRARGTDGAGPSRRAGLAARSAPLDRGSDRRLRRDAAVDRGASDGCAQPNATQACGPGRRRTSASGSRLRSGRPASFDRPTRSCGRPRRMLRWRRSTAGRGQDRLHRRPSRSLRGRADLPAAADRPVDLPRPCRTAR